LRAYALQHGSSWDKSLPYADFSYDNNYQASLKMLPFEALYGRKCRTPLFLDQTRGRQFFGPKLIQEVEELSHPGFGAPRPGREHNHQVCWDQVSHI
jgi:hypothetical protein